jgi:hypothetical protein
MEITKLKVGDRFFNKATLVTMQVTEIWCVYNPEKMRWESWVEYGTTNRSGDRISFFQTDPAWEFLNALKKNECEYEGRKNPAGSPGKVFTDAV